jgi:hypothetical protein
MISSRYGVPVLIVALFLGSTTRATAVTQKSPVGAINTADGIGVKGYDPGAYFVAGVRCLVWIFIPIDVRR